MKRKIHIFWDLWHPLTCQGCQTYINEVSYSKKVDSHFHLATTFSSFHYGGI